MIKSADSELNSVVFVLIILYRFSEEDTGRFGQLLILHRRRSRQRAARLSIHRPYLRKQGYSEWNNPPTPLLGLLTSNFVASLSIHNS